MSVSARIVQASHVTFAYFSSSLFNPWPVLAQVLTSNDLQSDLQSAIFSFREKHEFVMCAELYKIPEIHKQIYLINSRSNCGPEFYTTVTKFHF